MRVLVILVASYGPAPEYLGRKNVIECPFEIMSSKNSYSHCDFSVFFYENLGMKYEV